MEATQLWACQFRTFAQRFVRINVQAMEFAIRIHALVCAIRFGCRIYITFFLFLRPIAVCRSFESKIQCFNLVVVFAECWLNLIIFCLDWSILYVVIGVFIIFILISAICFGLTRYCRTSKPRTRAKSQKYSLLESQDNEAPSRELFNIFFYFDTTFSLILRCSLSKKKILLSIYS